jgi:hypothetical protein
MGRVVWCEVRKRKIPFAIFVAVVKFHSHWENEKILARHRDRDSEQLDITRQSTDADAVQLHAAVCHAVALAKGVAGRR